MKTLLLIGDDKIGRSLLARVPGGVETALDRSSSWRRAVRVLLKGSVSPAALWMMWRAESRRRDARAGPVPSVRSNAELLERVRREGIERLFLFRAGLIVNRALLAAVREVLNIHCARLPEYGGLGAIPRALRRGDYRQCATMHRVTEQIDAGEVIATLPYDLDPARSYFDNEQVAYEAGMKLLLQQLPPPRHGSSVG
jgi:hypothetical protein